MSYVNQITEPLLLQCYAVLFFVSSILCFVIILSSSYGFSRRAVLDQTAIQSAHRGYVPRVGGLAIYLTILGLIPLLSLGFIPLSVVFDLKTNELILLIVTALPVFCVGLAEDLGFPMMPKRRLIAAAFSGVLATILLKVWIFKLGIPLVDDLLLFAPLGIFFTIFATVGVVNAFNLIDGLNGLSSYVAISSAVALSIIAFEVGNSQITIFLNLFTATILGFMVLNFPFGKIFLGDAGAYVLGHLLVWASILLINYEPSISPFAILLVFFWPVADTGLAIWRRLKLGNPTDRPDRLHFHQLTMRYLEIRFFGRDRRYIANPLATITLIPLISVPQVLGVLYWNDMMATIWITFLVGLIFIGAYLFGLSVAKKSRLIQGRK